MKKRGVKIIISAIKSQQGKSAKKRQIAEKGRNYTQNP